MAAGKPKELLSDAARRHVRRQPPPSSPASPPSAATPVTASAGSPPPGQSPLVAPQPPGEAWRVMGAPLKRAVDPLYKSLGAAPVAVEQWEELCRAWGAVADYYVPMMSQHPLGPALVATALVAAPLYVAWTERQAEAEAKRALAAAAATNERKAA